MPLYFKGMRWSEKMTVHFINEYIKHTYLYKINSTFYRNRQKRNIAFLQISKRMGIPGFGPQEAHNKIKILRSTFSQELKKIRNSNGYYTPALKWFPILHDALVAANGSVDFKDTLNSQNYYNIETVSLPEAPEDRQDENDSHNYDPDIVIRVDRQDVLDSHDDTETQLEEEHLDDTLDSDTKLGIIKSAKSTEENYSTRIKDPIPDAPKETINKKNTRKRTHDQYITKKQYDGNSLDEPADQIENEFDIFGKSIAAQLKNMPLEIAIKAQMHVQNYLSSMRLKALKQTSRESPQSSPCH